MEKFTVEEFRVYLQSQDNFGDALHNLSEENIKYANAVNKTRFYVNENISEPDLIMGMLGN